MENLMQIMTVAIETKPKKGEACNHCGYCCLTEVCVVGQQLGGGMYGPCKLLKTEGDKHMCSLADTPTMKELIGMGTGCCAETQNEVMARLTSM